MARIISRSELLIAIDQGNVVVLEALPPAHYAQEHIPGSHNLPLDDLDRLGPLLIDHTDTAVVTYCSNLACANSKAAATRLEALGFTNVAVYEAGKQDWIEAGLPVETGADDAVTRVTD